MRPNGLGSQVLIEGLSGTMASLFRLPARNVRASQRQGAYPFNCIASPPVPLTFIVLISCDESTNPEVPIARIPSLGQSGSFPRDPLVMQGVYGGPVTH